MNRSLLCITEDADDRRLELAAIGNHRDLFRMNAEAMHGTICEDGGLLYTFDGSSRNGMACWLGNGADEIRPVLDDMMAFYRMHKPKGVGWWSLDPPQPDGIGALLLARGFQPGWKPCWMALDMGPVAPSAASPEVSTVTSTAASTSASSGLPPESGIANGFIEIHDRPDGLEIIADNEVDVAQARDLPYAGDQGAVSRMLMKTRPDVVRQFIARWHGKLVGHCCVVLNAGESGVAGIYNVAVLPEAREQGIGKALVVEACRWARGKGLRYVTLNATGRRMYSQIGFRWVGDGSTWWVVNEAVFGDSAPGPRAVALAEAVGLGDIQLLERLMEDGDEAAPVWVGAAMEKEEEAEGELDQVLSNRLSLIQIAIHCKQYAAAEWLVDHGAACSVLEAWDLGWKDRAGAMLAADPALVNKRYGEGQTTLLHIAADRNDMALARMALLAGLDMSIRDRWYKSTPSDWAKFFKRDEMIQLFAKG